MSLPLFQLPDQAILGLCVVGWAAWSIMMGYLGHRLPLKFFEKETWLTRPLRWGEDPRGYERVLRIKAWKHRLPEAGNFFPGGFSKDSIGGGDRAVMTRFLAETRRAEYVHLAIWPFWLVTLLWAPGWGVLLNLVVGTALNLPCLLVQRYNRMRLQRAIAKRARLQAQSQASINAIP